MKSKGYIYGIKSLVTGKFYIGQAINRRRKAEHFSRLRSGKHGGPKLLNSYNKHGEVFVFGVIEPVSREKLNERETYWIKKFDSVKNGYNCDYGGHNPVNPDICKKVRAFEPDGVTYTDYPSVIEASRQVGVSRRNINSSLKHGWCCRGKRWFYLDKGCPEKIDAFKHRKSVKTIRAFEPDGKTFTDYNGWDDLEKNLGITKNNAYTSILRGTCAKGYKIFKVDENVPEQIEPFTTAVKNRVKYKQIKATCCATNKVIFFDMIKDFCEKYNISSSNVSRACKSSTRTCCGFKLEYII